MSEQENKESDRPIGQSAAIVHVIGCVFFALGYALRHVHNTQFEHEFEALFIVGVVAFVVFWGWSIGLIIRSVQAHENSKWVPLFLGMVVVEFIVLMRML